MGRVVVGMSGGVDSSVAAHLLIQQGYDVAGLFMKNWEEDDGTEYCTAIEDLADAAAVCRQLGIDLHEANFAAEYWDNVFEHFLSEYRAGRTPNPDVLCNREIKFKVFLDYARLLGAEYIATGHYAQVQVDEDGNTQLVKAVDANKDQTYFLQSVDGGQLAQCIFPLGELCKSEVREIAESLGFTNHAKKDSTGICFIGERRFKDFLSAYLPAQPGDIVTLDGEVIGQHQGLMYHTLGQRQGLGIGGLKQATDAPWYVVAKDIPGNRLVVGQGNDNPALFSRHMRLSNIAWINMTPKVPSRLAVKVRYRQKDQLASLDRQESGDWHVTFDEPQRAVTPGQWACFYDGAVCLGGGIIEASEA